VQRAQACLLQPLQSHLHEAQGFLESEGMETREVVVEKTCQHSCSGCIPVSDNYAGGCLDRKLMPNKHISSRVQGNMNTQTIG
jgi:hypothetical protein